MLNVALPTDMQKTHSYYHLVTAKPPFIHTRIDCMHKQKLGREYSRLPSITPQTAAAQNCHLHFSWAMIPQSRALLN